MNPKYTADEIERRWLVAPVSSLIIFRRSRAELVRPRSGRGVWGAAPTKQASFAPAQPPAQRGQKFGQPWPNFWSAELVDVSAMESLADLPVRRIEDRYLQGTALRLRKVVEPSGAATYKLGKKYGKLTRLSEPVVSIYLGEDEHNVLARLPGTVASKARYALLGGSLDVYRSPRAGFAVFEVELTTEDEANAYAPPGFTREEITGKESYSGFALAASAG